ncbi:hypothetical protein [Chromohalobacter sp. 296-RDG]|uniref:hypothetical protein n=1 Tax=Chromohalobacter sp. 296-RDG TaxID=2994062 RepID=UPI00246824F2|nr:hypothetical protein [Chromohalobacter sp. 296-RDG]
MAEVGATSSQLDRIEQGLAELRELNTQILDRLTRMEERQNGHAADLEKAEARIEDLSKKVHQLEVGAAVADETGQQRHSKLSERWNAASTIGLLLLGAALSMAGRVLTDLIRGL